MQKSPNCERGRRQPPDQSLRNGAAVSVHVFRIKADCGLENDSCWIDLLLPPTIHRWLAIVLKMAAGPTTPTTPRKELNYSSAKSARRPLRPRISTMSLTRGNWSSKEAMLTVCFDVWPVCRIPYKMGSRIVFPILHSSNPHHI